MQTVIIHLDMNSYFASVEQQDNPAFRGRVLGVCEHLGGIIIAASIEAKKWGIKTGTPVWEAKKIYPKIILVHTRAEAYRHYHRRFLKVLRDYSNFVEPASIDEAYADLTKVCNIRLTNKASGLSPSQDVSNLNLKSKILNPALADPFAEAVNIAREIKHRMKKEVGDYLTCSIGIASNKLLAKIASDLQKPDGIVVISSGQLSVASTEVKQFSPEELYNKLKLTDIPGIAKRQEKRLNALGINTLRDLRDYPVSRLVRMFGINGYHLHKMGQLDGSWKAGVRYDETIKSIGHMYTLPIEYRQAEFFEPVLYKLCEMVGERLRRKKLMGSVVAAYARDGDYNAFGNSLKLGQDIFDARDLFLTSRKILLDYPNMRALIGRCKLIAVTISGLRPFVFQQSLFKKQTHKASLMGAIDALNIKYGNSTVTYAPAAKAGRAFRDSVGFGRVKEV